MQTFEYELPTPAFSLRSETLPSTLAREAAQQLRLRTSSSPPFPAGSRGRGGAGKMAAPGICMFLEKRDGLGEMKLREKGTEQTEAGHGRCASMK